MDVEVSAKAGERSLETKAVKLDPESAAELVWPGEAPEGDTALAWEFAAKDKSGAATDRLRVTQQVAPAVPITVQQATFARVDGELEIPAAVPAGAVSGRNGPLGGIEVGLAARISTPPPGLKRFFETYPFVCLEQKTSVAIGLRDAERWRQVVEAMPTYLDANGLARYFPSDERGNAGSPALTAYLLDASHAAGFEIPPELAQRMERGLTAFAEGRIKPEHWSPQSDLVVRKLAAIEALTRRGQKPLSALSSLEVEPLRLPTSAADLDFCQQVLEQERRSGAPLPIDSLIALTALRSAKRVTADELAEHIQRDAVSAKRTLEALTEAGLVEAHGTTRGRSYTLSASLYQASGDKAAYTRQAGFTPIQHEQMVLSYVQQHGQIQRAEVMDLCRLSPDQAAKLLKRMKDKGVLIQQGERRWAVYKPA